MNMTHTERVVILLDMDCFYCQVEEKLNSEFEGKPIAVVQYNEWRGGGIIAVNYPAREKGVTRHMRGEDAKNKCPDIILAKVPQVRGKADLTKYRDAGKRVADVLKTFTAILERASVDEAYLDVTDIVESQIKNGIDNITTDKFKNTYVVGYEMDDFLQNLHSTELTESNLKLCVGGIISEEIRAEVLKQTGYKCSAGIAHNKILAKLACGLHKPNKQTILPQDAIPEYFKTVPIKKITGLGGKFGHELLTELEISNMGELMEISEKKLIDKFGNKNGSWLYNIARGIDTDPVVTKLISKSIGCCKRFPGRSCLTTHSAIQHWMNELALEISERLQKDLEENNRKAKQMVISFSQDINNKNISSTRKISLKSYEKSSIAQEGLEVIKKSCQKADGSYKVTFLGISITNFQSINKSSVDIASFFTKVTNDEPKTTKYISSKLYARVTNEKSPEILKTKSDHSADSSDYNDSSDDEVGSHSDYSASTEDLEEDPKAYIYFEDIYPEFVSSQPLENYFGSKREVEFLVSEENKQNEFEKRMKSSDSFFAKYFATPPLERETSDQDSIEGNSFESVEADLTHENSKPLNHSEEYKFCKSKIKSAGNILPYLCEEPNENYCSECKRNISIQNVLSHSDYHVAKKLQAELNKHMASTSDKTFPIKVKPKKTYATNNIKNFFKPT